MNWKKYGFEFLSIFVAVISAFALNNWQENRRDSEIERKILTEIKNGLEKDLDDIAMNILGHEAAIKACSFWQQVIQGKVVKTDSLKLNYFEYIRDYIVIQNISGYESLKSRGLEFIKNDSLRFKIITLYEYDYETIRKFEEDYHEMQFQANYFDKINTVIAPHLIFGENGDLVDMNTPIELDENKKALQLSYLWKIRANRNFILMYYQAIKEKVQQLQEAIVVELS